MIEITIQIQTQGYLDKNGLLYKYQSGFCSNLSTDFCLEQYTDFILREMDKRFHTGLILVELQKAFDTLDHTVLSQKIECFAFTESVIKWFQSYLSNRKFFVALENVFPAAELTNWGVPQGIYLRAAPLPNIYK